MLIMPILKFSLRAVSPGNPILRRVGESVFEVVRVLSTGGNVDRHRARKAGQFIGARIGHGDDVQVRRAARHGRTVLEYEGAFTPFERSGAPLNGDVPG